MNTRDSYTLYYELGFSLAKRSVGIWETPSVKKARPRNLESYEYLMSSCLKAELNHKQMHDPSSTETLGMVLHFSDLHG